MKLDTGALQHACLELARAMRMDGAGADDEATRKAAEGYFNDAVGHEDYLVDGGVDPNFLARAVGYLRDAHAMPPLQGNMTWFSESLATLVGLACPPTTLGPEHEAFMHDLQVGLDGACGQSIAGDRGLAR